MVNLSAWRSIPSLQIVNVHFIILPKKEKMKIIVSSALIVLNAFLSRVQWLITSTISIWRFGQMSVAEGNAYLSRARILSCDYWERDTFALLRTAYPVDRGHTHRKLMKDYEAYKKARTAEWRSRYSFNNLVDELTQIWWLFSDPARFFDKIIQNGQWVWHFKSKKVKNIWWVSFPDLGWLGFKSILINRTKLVISSNIC